MADQTIIRHGSVVGTIAEWDQFHAETGDKHRSQPLWFGALAAAIVLYVLVRRWKKSNA
jgi:LPXTG-motif cell wall-anchored protein